MDLFLYRKTHVFLRSIKIKQMNSLFKNIFLRRSVYTLCCLYLYHISFVNITNIFAVSSNCADLYARQGLGIPFLRG